jgi:hypothetical protein
MTLKMAVFWVVALCNVTIAMMMGAETTSETSLNFNRTARSNKREDSHLNISRYENLKSCITNLFSKSCLKLGGKIYCL